MRLRLGFCLLLLSASLPAATARLIELRGHGRILAIDEPILKGHVFLFHRYPDGLFLSVPAQDVFGIATTKVDEKEGSAQRDTIVLGPTGEGRSSEPAPQPSEAAPALPPYPYYPYALYPYFGCCSTPRPPGPRPPVSAPPLVGPNGFPLTPGTRQPEIGPNGFPILAPSTRPR